MLEADLLALASDLAAAECRWLHMVAEFDRREGWAGSGVVSCAHWLSWRCGLSLTTAREKVRVAKALVTLPRVSASFEKGELSYSRARAIVRAADPENEELLIEIARHSTGAQLERIVRATVNVQRLEEVRDRRVRRTVHWHWDHDGSFVLRARLEPEEGAAILAALEAAQARAYARKPSSSPSSSPSPSDSAAAVDGADKSAGNNGDREKRDTEGSGRSPARTAHPADVIHDAAPGPSGQSEQEAQWAREDEEQDRQDDERDNGRDLVDDDAEAGDAAGNEVGDGDALRDEAGDAAGNDPVREAVQPPTRTWADDNGRPQPMDADGQAFSRADALVAVAEAFIAHDAPTDGADVFQVVVHVRDDRPPCLDDGPALLLQTALRMSCDASAYCIHEDARGTVLDVGRSSRRIRRRLRRALWQRDKGCRFPGCGTRRGVDAHHVRHWSDGGPTCLANLVLLCRRHHTAVHEGGFELLMSATGQPQFRTPGGAELLQFPDGPTAQHGARHWHVAEVAADAVESKWAGEKVDLGYVASVICQAPPERSRQLPAARSEDPDGGTRPEQEAS